MWTVELAVMAGMIAVNAIFAAYEIALASVSRARLQALAAEGRAGAKVALYMKENTEASLAVVQLGITLVGAIAAATGGAGAEERLAPRLADVLGLSESISEVLAIALIVAPLTVVTIIAGELVPKVFALRNKEWVVLRLSPVMRGFMFAAWPVVRFFETITITITNWGQRRWRPSHGEGNAAADQLQELREAAGLARTARLIGPHQETIILGATQLSGRPVREILLPAGDMHMLRADDSLAASLVAAHRDMHTRYPVTERPGDPQAIVGYVNFKDIVVILRLQPNRPSLRSIIRPLLNLADDQPIAACLQSMLRERGHIALVRDQQGKVLGMVTLEDILEELVGDIQDEYDHLPAHVTASGEAWVVGGGIGLDRLRTVTGLGFDNSIGPTPVRNLSDWVTHQLGRTPHGGDVLTHGDLRVVVRKVRRGKVLEAQTGRTCENGHAGVPSEIT